MNQKLFGHENLGKYKIKVLQRIDQDNLIVQAEPYTDPVPPPEPPPPPHDDHESHLVEVTPTEILFHGERVPRFAANAESVAVKSGNWSDPSTWSVPPKKGGNARIPKGFTVIYDASSTDFYSCIEVAGHLDFDKGKPTVLWIGTLMVLPSGCLYIEDAQAEVVFPDGPIVKEDTNQSSRGLLVFGEIRVYGEPITTFVRLAEDVPAGATVVKLQEAVNWPVGSRVLIPDTRHINPADNNYYKYSPQWEVRKVAKVEGNSVTLDGPLQFAHKGPRGMDGIPTIDFDGNTVMPHMACLSRSILFRSENPQGTRAHIQLFGDAQVSIKYAEFRGLGRTKTGPLNLLTNRVGRYAIHCHHLVGRPGGIGGHQFIIQGCSVTDNLKWGITVHGSHYGLIKDNVVVNTEGAGIATENGSETGNVFDHNFVCVVKGRNPSTVDIGDQGDGYWFAGQLNTVKNNVACNCYHAGFELTPETVTKSDWSRYVVPVQSPMSPLGQKQTVNLIEKALKNFSGNEIYGATETGITLWLMGDRRMFPSNDPEDVNTIEDTITWHIVGGLTRFYYTDTTIVRGCIHRGDPSMINKSVEQGIYNYPWIGEAMFNGGSVSRRTVFINADIQGAQYGYFHRAHGFTESTEINKVLFDNAVDILVYPWAADPPSGISETVYKNLFFRDTYSPGSLRAIEMTWAPFSEESALSAESHKIINYQQIQGLNVELFYLAQIPGSKPALTPEGQVPKGRWAPIDSDGDDGTTASIRAKALGVINGLAFITEYPSKPHLFVNVLTEDEVPTLYYTLAGNIDPQVLITVGTVEFASPRRTGKFKLNKIPNGTYTVRASCGSTVTEKKLVLPIKR